MTLIQSCLEPHKSVRTFRPKSALQKHALGIVLPHSKSSIACRLKPFSHSLAMITEEDNKSMGFPSGTVWENPQNPPKPDDYIFLDGKRLVRPYFFEFIAYVKQRWSGKKVEDLYAHEFRKRSYEYFVEAVRLGRIRVDEKLVSPGYIVNTTQKLSHFVHRHEPPVLAEPVVVLHNGNDVVTICKPASVPVHPCGQYRKNTVLGILEAEHGLAPLFPIHRLDRLVSGLLIFAKNSYTADKFREEIGAGKVQKEYMAKVVGIFPEKEVEVNANVAYDAREGRSTAEEVNDSHDSPTMGKSACTRFFRHSTNGIFSIVKCMPVTGRTHQIRVHLQYLGHPIANDELYCNVDLCSNNTAKTDDHSKKSIEDPESEAYPISHEHVVKKFSRSSAELNNHAADAIESVPKKQKLDGELRLNESSYAVSLLRTAERVEKAERLFNLDPLCTNCPNLSPTGYDEHEEGLWLHCFRYSGPNWTYECPLPKWAFVEQKCSHSVHG